MIWKELHKTLGLLHQVFSHTDCKIAWKIPSIPEIHSDLLTSSSNRPINPSEVLNNDES